MLIYIEDCLIENFFVTMLLLLTIKRLYKDKTNKTRLIFSSIFGSLIAVLYPIFNLYGVLLIIFKVFCGAIIVCMAFSKSRILAKAICFAFLTAMYGGINIFVYDMVNETTLVDDNFPTYIVLIMLYSIYYFSIKLIKLYEKQKTIANFVYEIEVSDNGKIIKDTAFLDSGNVLVDYDYMPIFIVNFNFFAKLYQDITFEDLLTKNFKNLKSPHYVKSCFASGKSKILVFSINCLKIHDLDKIIQINNARIGISYSRFDKNFNCNMLLNANAFNG